MLKPRSLNGVFFYNGDSLEGQGDFIMLQLVNGFVEFRFDLGNGAAIVRYIDVRYSFLKGYHSALISADTELMKCSFSAFTCHSETT